MFTGIARSGILGLLGLAFLAGCQTAPPEVAISQEVVPRLEEHLVLGDVIIVVDASGSMHFNDKFDTAKSLTQSFVGGMPDAGYLAGLISFGGEWRHDWVLHMPECFDRVSLKSTVNGLQWLSGATPLDKAIAPLASAYVQLQKPSALVIFSDGKSDAEAVMQTCLNLVAAHAGALCIHTVQVGDDEYGRTLLQGIAALTPCGSFREASSVASLEGMDAFIRHVFFGIGGFDMDSDGDGVPDSRDRCPNTPRGVRVDAFGCWSIGEALFAFDKWYLRPEAAAVMDEVAAVLNANPSLSLFVDGHTDSVGSNEYNIDLSINRAHSVFTALVQRGIDYHRLVPRAFGEAHPRVPNDTPSNRQLNRRVELRTAS